MATVKKAQKGYSQTANRVDSLRAVGAKQVFSNSPDAKATLSKLKSAETQEKKENKKVLSKKVLKKGGLVKKSMKCGGKMSKKRK